MGKHKWIFLLFAALTILYVGFSLLTPTDQAVLNRYGLSETGAKWLELTVILPFVAIWFVAFLGYARLKYYTDIIKGSKDGRAFAHIANGLLVLAIGLPVGALLASAISYYSRTHPDLLPALTITVNYVDIILGLLAFGLIYKGASSLVRIIKIRQRSANEYLFVIAFAMLGISYILLTLSNPARQFPSVEAGRAAYYMPDLLIVFTIILPYLFTWFLAFSSAYCIEVYRRNVKGVLYRSALGYLAGGIVTVIIARIATRYIISMDTLLSSASLKIIIFIVFIFLTIVASGFIFIMIGTRRLKRIEEV